MAGRNDWYRKTTWTSDDAEEFFTNLDRSGTDIHRAQYLKIQALTLRDAKHFREALELVELAIKRFPHRETTQIRKLRADCLCALGHRDDAVEAYRFAFEAQRAQRNIDCHVALAFAEAFHDVDDGVYRPELLELLREEVAQPWSFGPMLEFRYALMFARLFSGLDDVESAAKWADRALLAQRFAGRVDERTEIWLRQLAALSDES
jgi:tetratricopeptide (TPR) repeat protein